ncbi:MAG TPA: hypothetical protein VE130_06800 [Nitrososphaeraceae archaeon]|jgi:hypothetical protein|nr:hypothetical protein [Nitrososphaeraceae archaeon]
MMNSRLLAVLLIASMAAASVLLSTQNAIASLEIASLDIDAEETVEGGNATTTMMANQTGGNMTGNNSTS